MPPDGYETVTLPSELVDRLDHHAKAIGADSRADALRDLAEDAGDLRISARVEAIDDSVLDDLANRISGRTADEIERRLR